MYIHLYVHTFFYDKIHADIMKLFCMLNIDFCRYLYNFLQNSL